MSLSADPPLSVVPAAGGMQAHNLLNAGGDKLVFKVKCSNNTDYRVKPVFGFVDAGSAAPLEITRKPGPPKDDKVVILYAPAPSDATDANATFGSVTPSGNLTIPISTT